MSKTFSHASVSIDGYSAAPNQSLDNPFGEGGMRLASEYDLPFLGQIPLVQSIREGGDAGIPAMMGDDIPSQKAFWEVAAIAVRNISLRNAHITKTKVVEVVE